MAGLAALLLPRLPADRPSSNLPDDSARVYALWRPTDGGPLAKAREDKPVGGEIIIRVAIRSGGEKTRVTRAAIAEQPTEAHPTPKRRLPVRFTRAEPDVRWGDSPGDTVLQSSPLRTAGYHNFPHTIEVALSSGAGKLSGKMRVIPGNLVLEDTTRPRSLIRWDPAMMKGIRLSCRLTHAQKGRCAIRYEVFRSEENTKPIAAHTVRSNRRSGSHSWTWNGLRKDGKRADLGLVTYRITAEASPSDTDCDRSPYLRVVRSVDPSGAPILFADYRGRSNWGILGAIIPETETHVQWWTLADSLGKPASSGRVWMYDDEFHPLMETDVNDLQCDIHDRPDGRLADRGGLAHGYVTVVPEKLMWGMCWWVLHVVDDHADLYRDHKPKPALELN